MAGLGQDSRRLGAELGGLANLTPVDSHIRVVTQARVGPDLGAPVAGVDFYGVKLRASATDPRPR
jgi:hypothetical protein